MKIVEVRVKPGYIRERGNHSGRMHHEYAADAAHKINKCIAEGWGSVSADTAETEALIREAESQIADCDPWIAEALEVFVGTYSEYSGE